MNTSGKPIYVLADDLSGASEVAGVAFRYGLSASVLTEPTEKFSADTDLLVYNTDTRLREPGEARSVLQRVCKSVSSDRQFRLLFKKIDSVLRGHVLEEAGVLMEQLGYNRALLFPANPSKGRVINKGRYFINGTAINKTPFASDPEFPHTSSDISAILNAGAVKFGHTHVYGEADWPDTGVVTVDIVETGDIKKKLARLQPSDLCCGGADAFEALLKHRNLATQVTSASQKLTARGKTIIINGSTYKNETELECIRKQDIPEYKLADYLSDEPGARLLADRILEKLESSDAIYINVGMPEVQNASVADRIEAMFARLVKLLVREKLNRTPFHLYLTGGATASAIIKELDIPKCRVVDELSAGIVTLASLDLNGYITTKPGSYPWPNRVFNS